MRFGTDGCRGPVGKGFLTPSGMLNIGCALGGFLLEKREASNAKAKAQVFIAHDTRTSSPMLALALASGLNQSGVHVKMLGVLPTPGLGNVVASSEALAGIMVTASHNPEQDNGLKFFNAQGVKWDKTLAVWLNRYMDSSPEIRPWGVTVYDTSYTERYTTMCQKALTALGAFNYFQGLTVVLDCANGAMSQAAPMLAERLGIKVVLTGQQRYSGKINSGVGSLHPEHALKALQEHSADFALAFDGDGDRVTVIDAHGHVLDGDDILYVLATSEWLMPKQHTVVTTIMSNKGLALRLQGDGIACVHTPVGDAHVADAMQKHHSLLGAEPSGHVLLFPWSTTSDALLVGLLTVASLVKRGEKKVGYQRKWQKYATESINVALEGKKESDILVLKDRIQQALDACHLEDAVVRQSGTEPILRIHMQALVTNSLAQAKAVVMQALQQA